MIILIIPTPNGGNTTRPVTMWDKISLMRSVRSVWNAPTGRSDTSTAKCVHFDDFNAIIVVTFPGGGATAVTVLNPSRAR